MKPPIPVEVSQNYSFEGLATGDWIAIGFLVFCCVVSAAKLAELVWAIWQDCKLNKEVEALRVVHRPAAIAPVRRNPRV